MKNNEMQNENNELLKNAGIRLTFSNTIKAQKYISEICLRKNISLKELMNLPQVSGALSADTADAPQKSRAFMAVLECLRYPQLSACRKKYNKILAQICTGTQEDKYSWNFETGRVMFFFKEDGDYEIRISEPEK